MKHQNAILTIAIPTYNRNDQLHANLTRLLPQLTSECKLLILDNQSAYPVAETLKELLAGYPLLDVALIRNRHNIGGAANVLRCFELCETEWLWVLSDDDAVKPNAITLILENIAHHYDCLYLTFSSDNHSRTQPIASVGLEDFVAKLDYFGSALFVSTGIYRAQALKCHLKFAYHFLYTASPHLVLLLMSLGQDGRCMLLTEQIVGYLSPTIEQRWSYVNTVPGLVTLLDLPLPAHVQKSLAQKIWAAQPSPRFIGRVFLHAALENRDRRNISYLYDQTYGRMIYFNHSLWLHFKVAVYRLMVAFPKLSGKLLAFYYARLKGKEDEKYSMDDFSRL